MASTAEAYVPLCNDLALPAVHGNVALVARGGCTFVVKVHMAQLAGAIGVIVYNNVWGEEALSMGSDPEHANAEAAITIPSTMVSMKDGILLRCNPTISPRMQCAFSILPGCKIPSC